MNLDHHQATHLVQKLAWTLKDAKHDFACGRGRRARAVHRHPRRSRRWSTPTSWRSRYGAQDVSRARPRARTRARSRRCMLAKLGAKYVVVGHSERRAVPRGGRRARRRRRQGRLRARASSRSSASARDWTSARPATRSATPSLSSTGPSRAFRPSTPRRSSSRTSRSGPSARARSPPRHDAQEVCGAIRARLAELYSTRARRRRPRALRRFGEVRQHRRDHGGARRRRRAGRRREPGRRGVREDRALPVSPGRTLAIRHARGVGPALGPPTDRRAGRWTAGVLGTPTVAYP